MPRCLWMVVLPFFLGCVKDNNAPVAVLDYIELKREKGTGLYKVKFSSNFEFLNIFEQGRRPISSMLRCSLGVGKVSINYDDDQYVASPEPPEYIEKEIEPVTHRHRSKLSSEEKAHRVYEALSLSGLLRAFILSRRN